MAAALLLLLVAGCSSYGKISPLAYEYAKALYSITNRQAEEKLAEVQDGIEAAVAAGELSDREGRWFRDIIADAQQGKWKEANQACRAMMTDQVE